MIDRGEQVEARGIVGATFDADRALPDGQHLLRRQHDHARILDAQAAQAGERQQRGVDLAGRKLAQPAVDVAAKIDHPQVGRRASSCALRRTDEVPSTAASGSSAMVARGRAISTSRGSSRSSTAPRIRPSGSQVGRSLIECTARSIRRASSAASISLQNRPLPPSSASGRSVTRSPVVRMSRPRARPARRARDARPRAPGGPFRLHEREARAARADAQLRRGHGQLLFRAAQRLSPAIMASESSTPRPPVVLGIETSCDETGVALVDAERRVRAELLHSQLERHAPYRRRGAGDRGAGASRSWTA